ncbi:MAG: hypothetical protein EBT97_11450 [Actinobacteria bacterium]|nr:hypothetical protein [Actinomycetota bacterium]
MLETLGMGEWFKSDDELREMQYGPELDVIDEFFGAVGRLMRADSDVLRLVEIVRNHDEATRDLDTTRAETTEASGLVDRVMGRVEDLAKAHMRRFRPEVLKEVVRGRTIDDFRPTQIVDYVKALRNRAALAKRGTPPVMFLKLLGVPVQAFNISDTRIRLTASAVNPWTAMDPGLNDLIRSYWADDTDPKAWDEVRAALVDQGIDPERWRPPVRERTAATLTFPWKSGIHKPVAFDLPADAALDNGMAGPIRVGNMYVVGQDAPVKVAGTVRIVPTGWAAVSTDAEYAAVTALRLDDVEAEYVSGRYVTVTGKATYEVTQTTGEIRTTNFRVRGILALTPLATTAMAEADAGTVRVAAAKGLYGFPSSVEKTAGVANRRLAREASKIARAAMKRDAGVVDFLKTHAKREGSRSAKVLLAALKETLPRVAAAAEVGMYGHKARTAQVGIQACADVRLAAGRIAAELHGRKGDEHERITSFLKTHAAKGKCAYSGMILSCYPDAPVADVPPEVAPPRLASERVPSSVRDWLASDD